MMEIYYSKCSVSLKYYKKCYIVFIVILLWDLIFHNEMKNQLNKNQTIALKTLYILIIQEVFYILIST